MDIQVTRQNLYDAADEVDKKAGKYYDEYVALLTDVQTLTTNYYVGEDATAFCEKVNGFKKDFENMKDLMNKYATFLRNAANNYKSVEEKAIKTINNLR